MDSDEDDQIEQLASEVDSLKKALDREKTSHRKFVDSVLENEELVKRDFTKQIRELKRENVDLTKSNRQLEKDVGFYKQFVSAEDEVDT